MDGGFTVLTGAVGSNLGGRCILGFGLAAMTPVGEF
jgi:hypothetical protein